MFYIGFLDMYKGSEAAPPTCKNELENLLSRVLGIPLPL